ncbi:MAG TPA: HIT family protein [Stellaceae bacterium]|jgi:diadenosine tetraphosphate (Ap4A) HIT family hydrolase
MTDNSSWQSDRIASAQRGDNPMFVGRMATGLVFLHDAQFLPGWCVLFAQPQVGKLEELDEARARDFLGDMARLGRAVSAACHPRRVNFAIYGNTAPVLHAHVVPRYEWEAADRITQPVWTYPTEKWRDMRLDYDPAQYGALRDKIRAALTEG